MCASSEVVGLDTKPCIGTATYPEALAYCVGMGARLCTVGELANDEAKGSGCDLDFERVWTGSTDSEETGQCGPGQAISTAGSAE